MIKGIKEKIIELLIKNNKDLCNYIINLIEVNNITIDEDLLYKAESIKEYSENAMKSDNLFKVFLCTYAINNKLNKIKDIVEYEVLNKEKIA